uniref:TAFA chemokine like family member 5 n=1 Tax=Canis lupus familiaris TaxID=9615 RepID=A0A8C0MZ13_CANLF
MAPSPRTGSRQDATALPSMSSTFWAFMILAGLLVAYCSQLAAGTCEIVTLDRDSSQPRRTIARQTARCACRKGQIAGTTRARPACVDARIIKTKQWCDMLPCLEGEGCDLLINRSGWTCTQPGGRIKTTTVRTRPCSPHHTGRVGWPRAPGPGGGGEGEPHAGEDDGDVAPGCLVWGGHRPRCLPSAAAACLGLGPSGPRDAQTRPRGFSPHRRWLVTSSCVWGGQRARDSGQEDGLGRPLGQVTLL